MQCKNYTWVTRGTKMGNKNAEQKLRNKNCGTKNGGDHWTLGAGDLKCKCKKVSGTKMWNKNWWGLLDIGCWGPQVEVQKGQLNKNAEQKLVWTLLHLYLGSPLPNVQWSPPIFIPLFLFCIFVLLTFLHLHLRFPTPNVQESPPIFVPHFCSTDLYALVLRVSITQCPMVPTNFYSAVFVPLFLFRIFVPLTFLHLHLRSPTPNVQWSPPIFVPHFCSADLFALVLRVPITQCPMVPTNFYSALFCSAVFVPHFCSTDLFALVLRVPITQCPMVPTVGP